MGKKAQTSMIPTIQYYWYFHGPISTHYSHNDAALLTIRYMYENAPSLSSSDEEDSSITPHINGDISNDGDEEGNK